MSVNGVPGGTGVFSPLARAVLDRFREGVVLFDADGRLSYSNRTARRLLDELDSRGGLDSRSLLQRLGRLGGRIERLGAGQVLLGHAVYLPADRPTDTLADQERRTIIETLHATGWRLTETARRLGISRTTLWRRLREYGVGRENGDAEFVDMEGDGPGGPG